MLNSTVQYRLLTGFDDPLINDELWEDLQSKGTGDNIFMTLHWQRIWWEGFGRGKLLLILVLKNNEPIALAPLFEEEEMIFFVGSGGSDYLDIIGEINDAEAMTGVLNFAIAYVGEVLGFRFYHLPPGSPTRALLREAGNRMGWKMYEEGELLCPFLSIREFPEKAKQAAQKKSLLRHEEWFNKNGGITVKHFSGRNILPYLSEFFEQHISRRAGTSSPSLFSDGLQKKFYIKLCEEDPAKSNICFTAIFWQERAIAFHFGMNYKGNFLWYKPSFDISLAKHSPGEVLIRQLLLKAINENITVFDLGLGEEDFKKRFATHFPSVQNIGLYPAEAKNNV